MDSSDFPISRSPRKELQGPRPPALKIRKDSHKIKKPPVAPQPSHQKPHNQQQTQPRPPVIIYTLSPKVIHTNPNDFMTLVQRLTGSSSTSTCSSTSTSSNPFNDHDCGAISPAARYATIEKAKSPKDQLKQQLGGDVGFVEGIMEIDQVMERTNLGPGILSPGPASLPPIPPNFFSPASADPNPASQNPPQPYINHLADSPTNANIIISDHHDLLSQLQSLQHSFDTIQGKSSLMEENLLLLQQQRDDALDNNSQLKLAIQKVSHERDSLRDQVRELEASFKEKEDGFVKRIDEAYLTMEKLEKEMEFLKERNDKLELEIKEARDKNGFLLKINMDLVRPVKESLVKVTECVHDENLIETSDTEENREELDLDDELRSVWEEFKAITRLASEAESKVNEFNEMKKKEIRELESSVVSLTEENRDINSLLRVALVEKEAVERSLNKMKGNNEQKRVALLQFAERGLQRVGFGFMMGSGSNEQSMESSGAGSNTTNASAAASTKSDSSECEEEVVSLASTMERIMKNLRLENSQLRRSLEESRSDAERLQSLVQKQDKEIAENILYIKELEDRERVQAQNVEELLTEIKETEAEVVRWREACELEVEAAKKAIEEREKLVVILKQELEKTKANLEISNGKLKLKDELAVAAMAAQAAAERSLQLADSRAAGLRQRIEELTRQVEEAESKERRCNKVRHICWPWRAIKAATASTANNRVQNARRRMLPEMQALLQHNV